MDFFGGFLLKIPVKCNIMRENIPIQTMLNRVEAFYHDANTV